MYKNNYEKFIKNDLIFGQKYENWFGDTFLPQYIQNDDNQYDLKTDTNTYEIKTDSQCFIYYRFGFEVNSYKKLSGIWTTTADYWVCLTPIMNRIIIMKVDDIKQFIKEHKHNSIMRKTGDDKASKMVLWDWNYFMDNMENKEVINNIIPILYNIEAKVVLFNKLKKYIDSEECNERRNYRVINNHYEKLIKRI